MKISNQNKTIILYKKFENNKWLSFDKNDNKELIIKFLEQYSNDEGIKNIIQQFIISEYFDIIFTGNEKLTIDKPDKGNEMNDKMIEYLENMKRDILTHVDTSIASVRSEMQDMKNDIIDIVDSKIESVKTELNDKIESVNTDLGTKITNLDTKLTKEINEIKKDIKVLKREAEKAGWDLTPDGDDE